MNNSRGTLVFALLVAAIAGFALWQFKKAPDEAAEKQNGELLFANARAGEIEELNFDGSTRKFKLKKEGGRWNVVEPFHDLAEDTDVVKAINDIFTLRVTAVETGDGPILWEKYGLLDPDETIALKDVKGQVSTLRVGKVRTYDKGFYLKRNDEQKLLIAASSMASTYDLTANGLRNKKLDWPGSKVLSYSVTSKLKDNEMSYGLHLVDDAWLVDGKKTLLSTKLVTQMLDAIKALKADGIEFDDKDSADASELRKLGLNKPVAEFKLVFENPEGADREKVTREVTFAESPSKEAADQNKVYFVGSNNSAVYRAFKSKLQGLLKSIDSMRDPKSPFVFDKLKVAQIKYVNPDFKSGIQLVKQTDKDGKVAWQLKNPDPNKAVNDAVVTDFIDNVAVLESLEFLKSTEKMAAPEYSVEFKDDKGALVFKMDFGGHGKDAKSGLETYLARTSLVNQLVSIRKASIDKLVKPNFVRDANAPKNVTEVKKVEQEPHAHN